MRRLDAALDHLDPAALDATEAALAALTTTLHGINEDLNRRDAPSAGR